MVFLQRGVFLRKKSPRQGCTTQITELGKLVFIAGAVAICIIEAVAVAVQVVCSGVCARAIIYSGVFIVVAGNRVGTARQVASAEVGCFCGSEVSAGGHCAAIDGERIAAISPSAADTVSKGVVYGEVITAIGEAVCGLYCAR